MRNAGRLALATVLMLAAVSSQAQVDPTATEDAPSGPEAVEAETIVAAACCTVPARTVVEIEILEGLNSRTSHTRDMFAIRLVEPLTVDGRLVAPTGTPGVGEVVHAARARAAGKAGELILAVRYLDLDGMRLPLRSLRYGRSQGLDNSGAITTGNVVAAAILPVASVVGFLIAGGEVDIPAGTRAHALTSTEMIVSPRDE